MLIPGQAVGNSDATAVGHRRQHLVLVTAATCVVGDFQYAERIDARHWQIARHTGQERGQHRRWQRVVIRTHTPVVRVQGIHAVHRVRLMGQADRQRTSQIGRHQSERSGIPGTWIASAVIQRPVADKQTAFTAECRPDGHTGRRPRSTGAGKISVHTATIGLTAVAGATLEYHAGAAATLLRGHDVRRVGCRAITSTSHRARTTPFRGQRIRSAK